MAKVTKAMVPVENEDLSTWTSTRLAAALDQENGKIDRLKSEIFAKQQQLAAAEELKTKIGKNLWSKTGLPMPGVVNGAASKIAKSKSAKPAHCIATGCKNAHGGPRARWLCQDHLEASKKSGGEAQLVKWRQAAGLAG